MLSSYLPFFLSLPSPPRHDGPTQTVFSNLSLSQFQARIEQLKTQVQQKHQNGANELPNGANGSDYGGSGRYN